MTENQSNNKDWDNEAKNTKIMVSIDVEITAAFYEFLKDYLAFFGSKMTANELIAQMVYHESMRMQMELAEFTDGDHYVGKRPWALKHPEIALTNGLIHEEDEDLKESTEEKPMEPLFG